MAERFSLAARLRSFGYAFRGLRYLLEEQHNARIHALVTLLVVVAGAYFSVSTTQWGLLILAVVAVWSAEALNSAVEYLADAVHPDAHPLIERAKDVAAGGVLLAAIGAATVGLLVFIPYL